MMYTRIINALLLAVTLMLSGQLLAQNLASANAAFDRGEYANALVQYQQLAEQGEKFAQYRVGMMQYFGLGTDADIVSAYSWMATAAEDQVEIMKKFQLLMWEEMDADQRDEATKQAIRREMKAGTEVMDLEARRDRRRRELDGCTASRLGRGCDRAESFGLSFENRGLQKNEEIPYQMTEKEINAFSARYTPIVLSDFAKFDQ